MDVLAHVWDFVYQKHYCDVETAAGSKDKDADEFEIFCKVHHFLRKDDSLVDIKLPEERAKQKEKPWYNKNNTPYALAFDYFIGFVEALERLLSLHPSQENTPMLYHHCVRHPASNKVGGSGNCIACEDGGERGAPSSHHLTCTSQTKKLVEGLFNAAQKKSGCAPFWVATRMSSAKSDAAASLVARLESMIQNSSVCDVKVVHVDRASNQKRLFEECQRKDRNAVLFVFSSSMAKGMSFPPQVRVWDLRARKSTNSDSCKDHTPLINDMGHCFGCTHDNAPQILLDRFDKATLLYEHDVVDDDQFIDVQPDIILAGNMGGRAARVRVIAEALKKTMTGKKQKAGMVKLLDEKPDMCPFCILMDALGMPGGIHPITRQGWCEQHAELKANRAKKFEERHVHKGLGRGTAKAEAMLRNFGLDNGACFERDQTHAAS